MIGKSNYDKRPIIRISDDIANCSQGWSEIFVLIRKKVSGRIRTVITFECYPGVLLDPLAHTLREAFESSQIISAEALYKESRDLEDQFADSLTDDPVFGFMKHWELLDFMDHQALTAHQDSLKRLQGLIFVIGAGASHVVANPDLLIYADVARWEIQRRQRAHLIGNLGFDNALDSASRLYKHAFFIDWRAADRLRHTIYQNVDYFLDVNDQLDPRMLKGDQLRKAVSTAVKRPFRVVPFFDPGPWGGSWMREHFDLPDGPPNYAWCFDCVPEENSVLLGFGHRIFELPASVLVHEEPEVLLGERIYRRFGAEFPIRFDFLDTVNGGNLSLQVHPSIPYIRKHFGMDYTQDESYYILDCCEGAEVYLGLVEGVNKESMQKALEDAHGGLKYFPAKDFVNTWPVQKHDHFSIPAGTIHCSGKDTLVLEISATPYIFTFKLWDWGRLGLDQKPRPIHLGHGLNNIQWDRTTSWIKREIIGQVQELGAGAGWYEERTGLHTSEFLETRRHWFTQPVLHDTAGSLNVLNLVEGDEVIVESPDDAFAPLHIHYAETFIVPAWVGKYIIRPLQNTSKPLATIKAYVRAENA